MKDCTTCKYGHEDERLGIPMCHHPKRFSEDCVDFNMHEEKETEESEKPINPEAAMKELDEKIALVKQRGTWEGVDVDKYMDEVRGREPEKPVPADLEEAANEYAYGGMPDEMKPYVKPVGDEVIKNFIAGAKWQAEKDARDMYMSDNRHFEKVYQLGKKDMKEQMMKEAVEGKIIFLLNGDVAVNIGDTDEYKLGQKVRIIIVKEDEK